ncbi:MAG: hypothetical protein INH41_04580 [Myxococcaceae bacterium]|jgi:hypothetical protein|nr:hypothetical protein [Myxococcaceae bacterium]MCA3011659.1 hypothetical protein [Myxococcaceae bacterium]
MTPTLLKNAAAQVLAASLLGWWMLVPLQPWGKRFAGLISAKALLAAHLDWVLLGLMQALAAVINHFMPLEAPGPLTAALIAGGWLNAVPYLFRGVGVDAFVFAGPLRQRLATTLSGASAFVLTAAWAHICWQLFRWS